MRNIRQTALITVTVVACVVFSGCVPAFEGPPDFDLDVLGQIAEDAQAQGLADEELFDWVHGQVLAAYPALAGELVWQFNDDDGVPGQVAVLYHSFREYLILTNASASSDWFFLAPRNQVGALACETTAEFGGGLEITDFVLAGEMSCSTEGELDVIAYGPDHPESTVTLSPCEDKRYTIPTGAYLLEYGRQDWGLPDTLYADVFYYATPYLQLAAEQFIMGQVETIIRESVYEAFGLSTAGLDFFSRFGM